MAAILFRIQRIKRVSSLLPSRDNHIDGLVQKKKTQLQCVSNGVTSFLH